MEKDAAILMADLAGYTALTDVHGGASAARIVGTYQELVRQSIYGDCEMVQRIGDQVVLVSDNPVDLAVTAQNLVTCALRQRHFLSIHSGIHYGSIYYEDGNLFGSTINIASRIMNIAQRGQILCSSAFVNTLPTHYLDMFRTVGKFKLKNVLQEVELLELICEKDGSSYFHVDPVCHMLVDPLKEEYFLSINDQKHCFCSSQCMEIFKANPTSFIPL